MLLDIAYWTAQIMLGFGALSAVYRIYKGPSVLDRVISVDVILIIVGSVLLIDMGYRGHQDYILFVVISAVVGFLGAVAIARYVAVGDHERINSAVEPHTTTSALPVNSQHEASLSEDESTSWFTALAKSGFTPRKTDKEE